MGIFLLDNMSLLFYLLVYIFGNKEVGKMSRIKIKEENKSSHKWWHFIYGTSERIVQYRDSHVLPDKDVHTIICNKCGYCKTITTLWEKE
jgi:hypothetical protein